MQIKIKNDNKIITSAFFEIKLLSFNLFINTSNRWREFDFIESSDGLLKFGYYLDSESTEIDHDYITLIAENKADKVILNRLYFLLPDKEQLWIMFPDENVYK